MGLQRTGDSGAHEGPGCFSDPSGVLGGQHSFRTQPGAESGRVVRRRGTFGSRLVSCKAAPLTTRGPVPCCPSQVLQWPPLHHYCPRSGPWSHGGLPPCPVSSHWRGFCPPAPSVPGHTPGRLRSLHRPWRRGQSLSAPHTGQELWAGRSRGTRLSGVCFWAERGVATPQVPRILEDKPGNTGAQDRRVTRVWPGDAAQHGVWRSGLWGR